MERLYRRRVPSEKVITPELARVCSELSYETRRQIGLLIDRQGHIESVIIGDGQELVIPNLPRSREGSRLLRGIRLVHTHLNNQPLTRDDLTDLALLRLDLMVVLGVGRGGALADMYVAHLLPQPVNGKSYQELDPCPFHAFELDCRTFVRSLENEFTKTNLGLHRGKEISGAILVSVSSENSYQQEERLEELQELVHASEIQVMGSVIQRLHTIHPKYVLGPGKLKEVIIQALQSGADLLIFDRDLTPAQVRGISEMTEMRVLDRTQVILDIFARRAHTSTGKIQVELAQLRYRLPRLSHSNTAFSRLGGGIGSRGPGETKLETDRRRVHDRIRRLDRELHAVSRHRGQQQKERRRRGVPIVSVIGYTNAGKSTLFNALTNSHVPAKDRPFETLDTVSRRVYLSSWGEVLLTDTVGFIRELPKDLLAAFQTTLHELGNADLLLHVVDAHAEDPARQIEAVEVILRELGIDTIPRLLVLNKCDLLPREKVERQRERYQAPGVSALRMDNLAQVRELMATALDKLQLAGKLKIYGFSSGSTARFALHALVLS
jgi:GTP-binding protein HflX